MKLQSASSLKLQSASSLKRQSTCSADAEPPTFELLPEAAHTAEKPGKGQLKLRSASSLKLRSVSSLKRQSTCSADAEPPTRRQKRPAAALAGPGAAFHRHYARLLAAECAEEERLVAERLRTWRLEALQRDGLVLLGLSLQVLAAATPVRLRLLVVGGRLPAHAFTLGCGVQVQ